MRHLITVLLVAAAVPASAQERRLSFDSGWTYSPADRHSVGPFMGRESLRLRNTVAVRSDVSLEDGTIDFDVAVTEHRSFVYIQFRQTADGENEEIYIRPHKTNLPDAVQYAPVFRGQSAWQLFHGPGYTARVPIARGEWIHVRLVVQGQRAAFYLGDTTRPVMVIPRLARRARGAIALRAFTPADGGAPEGAFVAAYSNLVVRPGVVPAVFPQAPERPRPAGVVTAWQLSPAFVPPPGRLRALPAELLAGRAWPSHPVDEEGAPDPGPLPRASGARRARGGGAATHPAGQWGHGSEARPRLQRRVPALRERPAGRGRGSTLPVRQSARRRSAPHQSVGGVSAAPTWRQ